MKQLRNAAVTIFISVFTVANFAESGILKETNYRKKFAFRFKSEIITSEDLGNLIYGCTGRFFGFSMSELKMGSFVASLTGNSPDDARDEYYIQLGYDYYDTVKNRNGW